MTTLATKPAANRLQVSPNTLRNWSDQYKLFLSAGAQAGAQPERRFTEKDLVVLTYIKQLRAEGLQAPEITQRLTETTFQDNEVLVEAPKIAIQPAPIAPEALPAVQESRSDDSGVIMAITTLQSRFEALERSVGESRRDFVSGVAVGFIGAGLFFLIIVVLISIFHR